MFQWLRRIGYLLNRRRHEEALREEMDAHREMMVEPQRFGGALQLREASRDVWGWHWLDAISRDVRFAVRGLRRTPAFTLVTISSLAVGLALAACTVSVVNAYLIRSLPYPNPQRLYHVMYAPPGPWEPRGMTALDWTSVGDVVEHAIAATGDTLTLADGGPAMSARAIRVRYGFVEGLEVHPSPGRALTEADFRPGAERVVLIGAALWRDRFGSDPEIVGRLIRGEAESRPGSPESFRIAGVLAPGFYFGRDSRVTIDLLVPESSPVRTYMVRLRPAVSAAAAERRITEAARQAATSPIPDDWPGVRLESAHERYVGGLRPVLVGVTVAVALVLVIVGANVAVLMVLRAMRRQREVAVRLALGSSRGDLFRMLVIETSIVTVVALAAGVAITSWVLAALSPLIEAQLGRPAPGAAGIAMDTTVLLIVGGVSLAIALSISLAPLASWGRALLTSLRQTSRGATDGPSMRRLRHALIAFEVAGSLVLLAGCGLMVRSVTGMLNTDLGFDPDGLRTSRIMLRTRNYPDGDFRRFHLAFAERVSGTIGGRVAFSSWPPFALAPAVRIQAEPDTAGVNAGGIAVSPDYFSVFGIAIRQGREFTPADLLASAPVAIVSETLAARLWPQGQALGQPVRSIEPTPNGPVAGPWRTVVGIAADIRQAYDDPERADFYAPGVSAGRFATFYLRTSRAQPELTSHLRSEAADLDPDAVINEPRFVAGDNERLAGTKFITLLLVGFAAVAAFLAMLGIYGITAYAVQQRRQEVAIRLALGATGRAIVRMFLRDGTLLLAAGLTLGVLGGAMLSRVLRTYVFGVQPLDVTTYLTAFFVLLAAGLLAVWWPARRAAAGTPSSALNAQ
jgi:putative ABC transport system permease protein